ncbi:hypothetical protein [Altererythrobacter sp. Root672]|uniref:hypothetical protein n=1 Tax=Altererythrobacter sp. Root672 TaxID=1736584 RepID=UPI0006FD83EE|nr:hypothetical protein [Altererythrobacter sp. Root672]KRA84276.1 hypothetical protein ASD76_09925 [Altererythrobacter sp. Root672]
MAALLTLGIVAQPAFAQDEPAWVSVWEGQIGTYPVRACLESFGDGPGRGSYYYLSALEPISISEEDGEGGWVERAPGGDAEATWELAELTSNRVRGTWRQGSRSLPIDLKPVAWTEGEWGGPCSSAAFLGPRTGKGSIASDAAELEGWKYTRKTYRPAKFFAEDVSIETFDFVPQRPGDKAILEVLAADLPRETVEDDFMECLAGSIASLGIDGDYSLSVKPTLVNKAFLVAEQESGSFCGGAHPNYYTIVHTFDRQSGEEVDLFGWIGDERIDGEDSVIPDALRDLVMANWPKDEDASECREYVAEASYWSIGLAGGGLVFRPDLPHVATPCIVPVLVEWSALAPFLDAEGRAGLALLRGG